MAHRAREVYEKLHSAAPLTDKEVKDGMVFYRELAYSLGKCGPVFHLAYCEAHRVATQFEGYWIARGKPATDLIRELTC